ncbi:MAG: hypothetical protein PVF74_15500, partial [Anaerolineales bacterium]
DKPESAKPNTVWVDGAYIDLEVSNPVRVAELAKSLTYKHGGYLVRSDSWYWGEREHITLFLAVPIQQFQLLRDQLVRLGKTLEEEVVGEWRRDRPRIPPGYAEITLVLRPKPSSIFRYTGGWSPVRTLTRAFEVFVGIFGFFVDILIWILVVVGPFLLIGYGLWKIWVRLRAK